ncbi:hypothetical protein D1007_27091 [Hordeum vulgare]|nr:hypothetical protein D1007_27091 [Hordeum vulgare]
MVVVVEAVADGGEDGRAKVEDVTWMQANPGPESIEEQRARRALAEGNLTGPGLVAAITSKVAQLHIDEQRASVSKIVALLSTSVLGTPPPTPARKSKKPRPQRIIGAVKASRQSTRLVRLRSNLSSSKRTQASICVQLGIINKIEDFNDEALLAYAQFFREPMSPERVEKIAEIVGLASPASLQLPDAELQAILGELAGRVT